MFCSFPCLQVLIQGLQNLNRAVHQDVVAVQLLPKNQWVAPSSVVLQDDGAAKDDNVDEDEEEKVVNFFFLSRAFPTSVFSSFFLFYLERHISITFIITALVIQGHR